MANTPITPVRIPVEVKEQLQELAEAENRNVSNVIVTLLKEALASRKRKR